jgi:hypothetical protein
VLQTLRKGNASHCCVEGMQIQVSAFTASSDMLPAQDCVHVHDSLLHAFISNSMHAGAPETAEKPCEESAPERKLLQGAKGFNLNEEAGVTPIRMPQPTPANTPVGDAMGKALSGPKNM